MTEDAEVSVQSTEIAPLTERARAGIVVLLVFLAVVHVLVPSLAIDTTFLGLLALAAIVALFDIERIEWLGIKARRIRREPVPVCAGRSSERSGPECQGRQSSARPEY